MFLASTLPSAGHFIFCKGTIKFISKLQSCWKTTKNSLPCNLLENYSFLFLNKMLRYFVKLERERKCYIFPKHLLFTVYRRKKSKAIVKVTAMLGKTI